MSLNGLSVQRRGYAVEVLFEVSTEHGAHIKWPIWPGAECRKRSWWVHIVETTDGPHEHHSFGHHARMRTL